MSESWNVGIWADGLGDKLIGVVCLFFVAQLINVVLSTVRSIILIKGGKRMAIIFNVISYSISALVTAIIAGAVKNIPVTVLITAVTNFIGTAVGLKLIDRFRKDKLWRISATVKKEYYSDLITDLKANNIKFVTYVTDWDKIDLIDVFSKTKEDSSIIKSIFSKYEVRYTINTNSQLLG